MKKSCSVLLVSLFASCSLCADVLAAVQKKDSKGSVVNKNVKEEQVNNDKNKTRSVVNKNVKEENKFYGKVRLGLGYEYQRYTGGDMRDLEDAQRHITVGDVNLKKHNQAPVISLGYNLYYKLDDRFTLLGGLEAQGRYPVSGNKIFDSDNDYFSYFSSKESIKFTEYFRLNAKLGLKTDIAKNFSLETYGLVGMNIAKMNHDYDYESGAEVSFNSSSLDVGFTAGAGFDFLIADRFTIGAEYRFGVNGFKKEEIRSNSSFFTPHNIKTHSISAKVGYQF